MRLIFISVMLTELALNSASEIFARACVEALRNPQALGRTFEMYNEPGPAPTDWAALFGALKPDQ